MKREQSPLVNLVGGSTRAPQSKISLVKAMDCA